MRTDNLHEYSAGGDTEADWNTDINGNGAIDDDGTRYIWPHFYSVGTILGDFERLGVTGAFQFKPNDSLTLTADALYTRLRLLGEQLRGLVSPRSARGPGGRLGCGPEVESRHRAA